MEDKLLTLYQEAGRQHRFLLSWRYGIFAGYLVISATLYSEILKNNTINDCLIAAVGVFISIIFFLLHLTTTKEGWKCQNTAYIIEKMEIQIDGIYTTTTREVVKKKLDSGDEKNLEKVEFHHLFCDLGHTAVINWSIVFSGVGFFLFFLCELIPLICAYNHGSHSCLFSVP